MLYHWKGLFSWQYVWIRPFILLQICLTIASTHSYILLSSPHISQKLSSLMSSWNSDMSHLFQDSLNDLFWNCVCTSVFGGKYCNKLTARDGWIHHFSLKAYFCIVTLLLLQSRSGLCFALPESGLTLWLSLANRVWWKYRYDRHTPRVQEDWSISTVSGKYAPSRQHIQNNYL